MELLGWARGWWELPSIWQLQNYILSYSIDADVSSTKHNVFVAH